MYKRQYQQYLSKGHKRPVPGTGYSWWSGTLRRAIHARLISVGKYVTWSATAVDPRKGQPPKWAWWQPRNREGANQGRPSREKVNAYEYAKYNEFGTNERKKRPIFLPAFQKHHKTVAAWMQATAWKGILGASIKSSQASKFKRVSRWRSSGSGR